MATPSEADGWQRGDVIADKYVVEEVIGDGGMGTIVKALHRELDEFVAIKLVKAAWLAEPAVLSRFSREARAVAKLKGEHVARVLDVGKTAQGVPFMVME
ncbi:MAG TPA: serine/threonine protein kinase, partial [Polyangiaceae bacterium]|nr:serine/threonine protein kinase [Polyangiaceae bacterium]